MTTDILDLIEHLGSETCTREEKHEAVTAGGLCLICGLPWVDRSDPLKSCPHDEIQVIAFLRAKMAEGAVEVSPLGTPLRPCCGQTLANCECPAPQGSQP